ncbi:hypothetical protein CROQUDRAFT_17895, partial [Cronartium quercuum f. sp. fusiforme G11]
VDSSCGKSMSPDYCHVPNPKPDHTTVYLANDSTIQSTSCVIGKLPFQTATPIPALHIPKLHEPYLSVASLCNSGYKVLSTKNDC